MSASLNQQDRNRLPTCANRPRTWIDKDRHVNSRGLNKENLAMEREISVKANGVHVTRLEHNFTERDRLQGESINFTTITKSESKEKVGTWCSWIIYPTLIRLSESITLFFLLLSFTCVSIVVGCHNTCPKIMSEYFFGFRMKKYGSVRVSKAY
ncbi:hypothetical protein BC938DRAFT_475358 [Jimgerdemannia flammicorona]|uniref:Uncharacterized protein n=1 Tax=Jimgerdemannia flammicorona TaxID=994334 RepID=A0A433PW68_9FUNG|nr:hypothetical protein BC938DRAFT_475358 [Jimgerdemannia flammicorona]